MDIVLLPFIKGSKTFCFLLLSSCFPCSCSLLLGFDGQKSCGICVSSFISSRLSLRRFGRPGRGLGLRFSGGISSSPMLPGNGGGRRCVGVVGVDVSCGGEAVVGSNISFFVCSSIGISSPGSAFNKFSFS